MLDFGQSFEELPCARVSMVLWLFWSLQPIWKDLKPQITMLKPGFCLIINHRKVSANVYICFVVGIFVFILLTWSVSSSAAEAQILCDRNISARLLVWLWSCRSWSQSSVWRLARPLGAVTSRALHTFHPAGTDSSYWAWGTETKVLSNAMPPERKKFLFL